MSVESEFIPLTPLVDPFQRAISYLRVSVTDRCNLRCVYCMPEEGIKFQPREEILTLEEILAIVRVGAAMGLRKVRLTGGEPLVRNGIADLVAMINGVPGIEDISLTTNGIALPRMAEPWRGPACSGSTSAWTPSARSASTRSPAGAATKTSWRASPLPAPPASRPSRSTSSSCA